MAGVLSSPRGRITLLIGTVLLIALVVSLILVTGSSAVTYNFTSDGDFDAGNLQSVNHDAPNNDQLQISPVASTFPIMWIANAGEDSVSKIDTNTGKELARYDTDLSLAGENHSPWAGPAPSRTAVDGNGNVYVANRTFDHTSYGSRPPTVMKILQSGGIDRNGNSVIDTSTDANNDGVIDVTTEMVHVVDDNNNNLLDNNAELRDERVAWIVPITTGGHNTNGRLARSLCIAPNGNIWVGTWTDVGNGGGGDYFELNPSDGSIISGPHDSGINNYGCLVDSGGTLWGASISVWLAELDTSNGANLGPHDHTAYGSPDYGIALGNAKVYQATYGGNPARTYIEYDPATNAFSNPTCPNPNAQVAGDVCVAVLGVAVDGFGDIFVGTYQGGGMYKFNSTGDLIWSSASQTGNSEIRGVVVDGNGDAWAVHRTGNNISKFQGTDGTHLGVFPVGNSPYTYSDAAGLSVLTQTPTGFWTKVVDGGSTDFQWGTVTINTEPTTGGGPHITTGASITLEVRAANTQGGLDSQNYITISSGVPYSLTGQFLEVRVKFTANQDGDSPILTDLEIEGEPDNQPPVAVVQNVQVSADGGCLASASVDNGSSDPDGDPITLTQSPAGPYPLGDTSVTLTVEDDQGASSSATATVTVVDDTPPTIAAHPDTMVIANVAGGYSGPIGTATASDNCSVTITNDAPTVFPLGDTVVTWTATDGSGNTSTATQVVTVKRIPVVIDIKPGSDPSSYGCDAKGSIPVAILSTAAFDATTIDADTVLFGEDGDETGEVHQKNGSAKRHVEDVNNDGLQDMVFHFLFSATDFDCADIPAGQQSVTLAGKLTGNLTAAAGGIPLGGVSDLRLVTGKKGKK